MITLYSTAGCHLCEQAYALLSTLIVPERIHIVDVSDDDDLFHRYGTTIPVLSLPSSYGSSELGWPFDKADLAQWLINHGFN